MVGAAETDSSLLAWMRTLAEETRCGSTPPQPAHASAGTRSQAAILRRFCRITRLLESLSTLLQLTMEDKTLCLSAPRSALSIFCLLHIRTPPMFCFQCLRSRYGLVAFSPWRFSLPQSRSLPSDIHTDFPFRKNAEMRPCDGRQASQGYLGSHAD